MNQTSQAQCAYSEALQWTTLITSVLVAVLQIVFTALYSLLKRTSILDLVRLKPTPSAKQPAHTLMDLEPGTWLALGALAAGGYFVYRIFNPIDNGDDSGDVSKLRKKNYAAYAVPGSKFPLADVPPGSCIKLDDTFAPAYVDPAQINHF